MENNNPPETAEQVNGHSPDQIPTKSSIKWNLIHSTRWIIIGFILIITARIRRSGASASIFTWAAFLYGWYQFFRTLRQLDDSKDKK